MKVSKVFVFAIALLALASVAAAQGGRPSQCNSSSGKWDSDDINCDFTCSGNGWELDCETKSPSSISCKVDQDGAPDSADAYFTCNYSNGQAPSCDFSAIEGVSDMCVVDTVKKVMSAWKPADDGTDDTNNEDNED